MTNLKLTLKSELILLLKSLVAMTIFGILLNLVSWQFKLISGGMPGYALILSYMSGWPLGLSLWLINVGLILISLYVCGLKTGVRSIIGICFFSVMVDWSRNFLHISQYQTTLINELLMLMGFGFISGMMIWMVIKNNYSIGGYSLVIRLVNRYQSKYTNQQIMLGLDIILAGLSALLFNWKYPIYILIDSLGFYWGMELMDWGNMKIRLRHF